MEATAESISSAEASEEGSAALPTVVVILEVIPRANATARLLGIVIVLDASQSLSLSCSFFFLRPNS